MPLVNAALIQANTLLGRPQDDRGHLWGSGRGVASSGRPDWSFCSPSKKHQSGRYVNLVPGDTKLSTKWQPSLRTRNLAEWRLPVRQVLSYGRDLEVRYGFLITNTHLTTLRFRREKIGDGMATNRLRRAVHDSQVDPQASSTPSVVHATTPLMASTNSTDTAPSSEARPPSSASTQESLYSNSDPTNEFLPPEYCQIPWSDHNMTIDGKTQSSGPVLTVRLGIFYLCLLARYSPDTSIGYDYPPLDSWTRTATGYVHNSTGKKVTQLPENATIVDPRPRSSEGSRSNSSTRVQTGSRDSSTTRAQTASRSSSTTRAQPEPAPTQGSQNNNANRGGSPSRATRTAVRIEAVVAHATPASHAAGSARGHGNQGAGQAQTGGTGHRASSGGPGGSASNNAASGNGGAGNAGNTGNTGNAGNAVTRVTLADGILEPPGDSSRRNFSAGHWNVVRTPREVVRTKTGAFLGLEYSFIDWGGVSGPLQTTMSWLFGVTSNLGFLGLLWVNNLLHGRVFHCSIVPDLFRSRLRPLSHGNSKRRSKLQTKPVPPT